MIYGREALRKHREERAQVEEHQERQASLLSEIPGDAQMDDATITVWDGQRFVAWEKWLAARPVLTEDPPQEKPVEVPLPHGRNYCCTGCVADRATAQEGLWQ